MQAIASVYWFCKIIRNLMEPKLKKSQNTYNPKSKKVGTLYKIPVKTDGKLICFLCLNWKKCAIKVKNKIILNLMVV